MASYKLVIKPSAAKEFENLPTKVRIRLAEKIFSLSENPRPLDCQELFGRDNYRIRQGDDRVIYEINDREQFIRVMKIGHRREVYR